jgi:hypothetical protein
MFTRVILLCVMETMFCAATLTGQQTPPPSGSSASSASPASSAVHEFPVVFQENIIAGKISVGAKVHAKLAIATLVNGTVVPRNAVFSGEVLESVGKTKTDSSRLAIRFDSAQWKSITAKTRLYVTTWLYPTGSEAGPDLQYGPQQSDRKTWNGMGEYPSSDPTYRPFPKSTDDKGSPAPETPAPITSGRRIRMKDVESQIDRDGVITLVSTHSNIKLDKVTMYVISSSDFGSAPNK